MRILWAVSAYAQCCSGQPVVSSMPMAPRRNQICLTWAMVWNTARKKASARTLSGCSSNHHDAERAGGMRESVDQSDMEPQDAAFRAIASRPHAERPQNKERQSTSLCRSQWGEGIV